MKSILFFFFVSLSLLAAPLQVLCTIPPQVECIARIGGREVSVQAVVPSGASPETYSPSARQMMRFAKAEAIFLIGVPMEANLRGKLRGAFPKMRQIDATIGMRKYPGDPHLWLSVQNMLVHLDCVLEALVSLRPEKASVFRQNAAAYRKELLALQEALAKQFASRRGQGVLVWHPAFSYLLEPFGVRQLSVEEEGKETTPRHLTELRRICRQCGARTLVVPPQANPRNVANAAGILGVQTVIVDPIPAQYIQGVSQVADSLTAALVTIKALEKQK